MKVRFTFWKLVFLALMAAGWVPSMGVMDSAKNKSARLLSRALPLESPNTITAFS